MEGRDSTSRFRPKEVHRAAEEVDGEEETAEGRSDDVLALEGHARSAALDVEDDLRDWTAELVSFCLFARGRARRDSLQ